jgi:hypothetical protein
LNFVKKDDTEDDITTNQWVDWVAQYTSNDQDPTEPMIRFLYPVLDTAADENVVTVNTEDSSAVAVVATSLFFKTLFEGVLSDKHHGLVMVFSNACNQTFTYLVDGKEPVYVGPGDLHDDMYDYLEHEISFADMLSHVEEDTFYAGLDLNFEYCPYNLTTYASKTMEDSYKTNSPYLFALASIAIFAFTGLLFVGYDQLVRKRQEKVLNTGKFSYSFDLPFRTSDLSLPSPHSLRTTSQLSRPQLLYQHYFPRTFVTDFWPTMTWGIR